MILYKYDLLVNDVTENGNGCIGSYEHTPDSQIKKNTVFFFFRCTVRSFCPCHSQNRTIDRSTEND